MALAITLRNRQKHRAIDTRFLRRIIRALLAELLHVSEADLGFFLVAAPEMTRLNETFLRHAGSTDTITFNYAEDSVEQASSLSPYPKTGKMPVPPIRLHGEVFICVDEAVAQARRFRTSWQSEVVRYAVHGALHLLGHDDMKPAARQQMKREENRLLKALGAHYRFQGLSRRSIWVVGKSQIANRES